MDVKFQKVGVIVVVTLLTLGILIGIQFGWKKYMLDDPVLSKLSSVPGVSKVTLGTDSSNSGTVVVKLGKVSNIKATCQSLLQVDSSGKILLQDNRSPELQSLLENVRFNIEEAIVKGDFTEMRQAIDSAAQTAKLDNYAVYMDSEYIYVQFGKGNNYLYQVFARQPDKAQIFSKE